MDLVTLSKESPSITSLKIELDSLASRINHKRKILNKANKYLITGDIEFTNQYLLDHCLLLVNDETAIIVTEKQVIETLYEHSMLSAHHNEIFTKKIDQLKFELLMVELFEDNRELVKVTVIDSQKYIELKSLLQTVLPELGVVSYNFIKDIVKVLGFSCSSANLSQILLDLNTNRSVINNETHFSLT